MEAVVRVFNRQPLIVCGVIALLFALGTWKVRDYVLNVVQPRQRAVLLNEIAAEAKDADGKLKLRQFDRALSTYQVLLKTREAELADKDKGRLHHQAGLCLIGLAQGQDEKKNLGRAADHFKAALQFRPLASDPAGFADSQVYLGKVLIRLSHIDNQPELFANALAAFGDALSGTAPESDAPDYARVQVHIGNAHRDSFVSGREQKDDGMNPALGAYESALRSAGAVNHADVAALAYQERGRAYLKLADGVFKRTNTRAALADFEAALQGYDEKNHPAEFGRTQELIGDTYTKMYNEVEVDAESTWRATQMRYEWETKGKLAYAAAARYGIAHPGQARESSGK